MKNNRKNRKKQKLKRKFEFINGVRPFKVGVYCNISDDSQLIEVNDYINDKLDKQFNSFINKYKLNKYKHLFEIVDQTENIGQISEDFMRDLKIVVFSRTYKSKKDSV